MDPRFPTFRRFFGKLRGLLRLQVPFPSLWPWYTTRGQRQSLLRLIAVATEENLPIASVMESWAADEHGVQQRRLKRLVKLMKSGTPLVDAVEQIPGVLSDEEVLAVRFGAQSGTLAASVRQQLAETESIPAIRPRQFRGNMFYVGMVIFLGFLVVTFVHVRIVPEFQKILQEFKMEEPSILRCSIGLANAFASYWWLLALILFVVILLTSSARPGRLLRNVILSKFFRPIREQRTADVLEKLSLATAAGRPIQGALSTLARYHFDPTMRHQLLFIRNEIDHGADPWQCMASVGLLTQPEAHVLDTSARVGNRPWVLSQLALGKRRRTARQLERMSDLALPAIILLLGAIVLFQALAIFMPLIQMISGLAV